MPKTNTEGNSENLSTENTSGSDNLICRVPQVRAALSALTWDTRYVWTSTKLSCSTPELCRSLLWKCAGIRGTPGVRQANSSRTVCASAACHLP